MSETISVATTSVHKLEEITALLHPLGFRVQSCRELGEVEVVEDGNTFLANARKKARAYLGLTADWVLADDSGLEVPALGGEPGVRSARYAAEGGPSRDRANNARLLDRMKGLAGEARQARFVCAMVLGLGGREVCATRGVVDGTILAEPRGTGGFGYDPLFFHPPSGKTFAQLGREEKNRVSHRGRALLAIAAFLRTRCRGERRFGISDQGCL